MFLVGWAGWGIYTLAHPAKNVTVQRTVSGTISLLNQPGDAGCVKPTDGGSELCGVFYIDPAQKLHDGQKVSVAQEQAHWHGMQYPLLVVYSSPSE
jgi:hypothetical protein